ncbi:MAG TPA: TolC family protein [Candidatus Dormibacteraeota bacterium]|nr:TolC family protein [Candidatus Dormibacteraeota bacterium]
MKIFSFGLRAVTGSQQPPATGPERTPRFALALNALRASDGSHPVWFKIRAFALVCLSLLLAGCHGVPTKSETAARDQAKQVASTYRPGDKKPLLPVLTTNSPLRDFVTYAMLNQPKVEATYYDWLGSIERITVARSLPDPQLTFQMDIQNIVTSVMPGLMVNLPGPGKLRAAADVASAVSEAKFSAFEAAALETAFDVKRAYYQLYFLEERLRINRETLTLLRELEQLALVQNEVGKVTLQDVLRAQIEQDRLKSDVANLEDSRGSLLEQFKAALGMEANKPAPPLPSKFESTSLDLSSDQVLSTAIGSNKELQGLVSEVRAAEAAIGAADKGRRPDFAVGLMADAKTSPVLYRPLATVTLPIWRDKIAAQIAEGQANKHAAEARLSAAQINLAVAFAEKSYSYREATRNLTLLQDGLLPKQRQSLEVARSGYLAGQIDFFNLTDAEQTLLGFAMAEVEARSQRELALAELSLIITGMTPSNSSINSSGAMTLSKRPMSTQPAAMK